MKKPTAYSIAAGPIKELGVIDNHEQICARLRALGEISQHAQRLASTKVEFADGLQKLWDSLPDASLTWGSLPEDAIR